MPMTKEERQELAIRQLDDSIKLYKMQVQTLTEHIGKLRHQESYYWVQNQHLQQEIEKLNKKNGAIVYDATIFQDNIIKELRGLNRLLLEEKGNYKYAFAKLADKFIEHSMFNKSKRRKTIKEIANGFNIFW